MIRCHQTLTDVAQYRKRGQRDYAYRRLATAAHPYGILQCKGCQYNGTLPHNHVSAAGDQLPLCTSSYSPASLSGFVQVKTHRICERPRPGLKGTWVKGGGSAGQDRQHRRNFAAGLSSKRRISTRPVHIASRLASLQTHSYRSYLQACN